MGYVSVKAIPNLAPLAGYLVYGTGAMRAQHLANGTNRLAVSYCEGQSIAEFVNRAQRRAMQRGRKHQAFSYVQSFPADLFDVKNADDLRRVNELGYKLAKEMHPDSDVWIVTHADGCGMCAHNHVIVMNHVETTGRALTSYRLPAFVRMAENRLMDAEGLPKIDYGDKKLAWPERAAKLSEGTFMRALGDACHAARTDPRTRDVASYDRVLAEHGVTRRSEARTDKDGVETEGWTYSMLDDLTPRRDPSKKVRNRRSAASRLSPDFTAEGMQAVFDARQAGRQVGAMTDAERQAVIDRFGLVDPETGDDQVYVDALAEYCVEHCPEVYWDDEVSWDERNDRYGDDMLRQLVERADAAATKEPAEIPAATGQAVRPVESRKPTPAEELYAQIFGGSLMQGEATTEPSAPAPGDEHEARIPADAPALAGAGQASAPAPAEPEIDVIGDMLARVIPPVSAPAPTGDASPSAPAPVEVEEAYVSPLRAVKAKAEDDEKRAWRLSVAAFDEATLERLEQGLRPVEGDVPQGLGPKRLAGIGQYLHPRVHEQLQLRQAKKAAQQAAYDEGAKAAQELKERRAGGDYWSEAFEDAEFRRKVANRKRDRLAREIAEGIYEEVKPKGGGTGGGPGTGVGVGPGTSKDREIGD